MESQSKFTKVSCFTCNNLFDMQSTKYRAGFKRSSNPIFYCSRKCFYLKRRPYQKSENKIEVECCYLLCKKKLLKYASQVRITKNHFCDEKCSFAYNKGLEISARIELICSEPSCNKKFKKLLTNYNRLKNKYNRKYFFCSKNCCANSSLFKISKPTFFYRNINLLAKKSSKKRNYKRSYLEIFIEEKIKMKFPDLEYIPNKKIEGFSFDLYFPKLSMAIEINGIRHYKPINGQKTLDRIVKRDIMRIELCKIKSIILKIVPVLETVTSKYKKEKYWKIIENMILENHEHINN